MKIVVYSAIFGGKDRICETQIPGFNYVLFTDSDIRSNIWSVIRVVPEHDPFRASRFFKLMPHRHLPDYDFSIWIDGNMQLLRNPVGLVNKFLVDPGHFHAQSAYDVVNFAPKGSIHENLYHEANLCMRLHKDEPSVICSQVEAYRKEGFPETPALWMGGVIVRQHNHPCSIKLGEAWFAEIVKRSRRDQIALPYVLWKLGLDIHTIDPSYKMTQRLPHLI